MRVQLIALICGGVWITYVWMMLMHPQKMGSDPKDKPQDPIYSPELANLVFAAIAVALAALFWRRVGLSLGPFDRPLDRLPLPATDLTLGVGLLIYAAGFSLRFWAIRLLGRFFTFKIGIREEHAIIEAGPYRWIRHPSYTGFLLMVIGAAVVGASLAAALVLSIGTALFLILRIRHEEAMLLRHFGAKYKSYSRRTRLLIPFIY